MAERIYFFKDYLIEHYGRPLYRIPVDLPLSCPNRLGTGKRGCIFCAESGARARHLRHHLDLPAQVRTGIEFVSRRYGAQAPYIAYFQSFTNTFADIDSLRYYYEEVLAQADFKMVIIATRPDCLPPEVMVYLGELNQRYDLWIELGVQTANDATLDLINRGHHFDEVKRASRLLASWGIKCAAHVILGLPYENQTDFNRSADELAALPFSGIKIHNLLVLKGTELARFYARRKDEPGVFTVMSEYEYAEALAGFIRRIPDTWPVMRITAEAPPEDIIAPKWWMSKGQFIDYVQEFLAKGGDAARFAGAIPKVRTEDGSYTFYHPAFKQYFHSLAGARGEALNKFVSPAELDRRLATGKVNLLDVGFGLGYNCMAALRAALECQGELSVTTLELERKTLAAALALFDDGMERELLQALLEQGFWKKDKLEVRLIEGDARESIRECREKFDVVFLDGFSPDRNPQLWSSDFIGQLAGHLKPDGIICTYSSAYPVIGAMLKRGLKVGSSAAFGRKRGGIVAAHDASVIREALDGKEMNIALRSTAGIPYRDRTLDADSAAMIAAREKLSARLRRLGIPRWFKG